MKIPADSRSSRITFQSSLASVGRGKERVEWAIVVALLFMSSTVFGANWAWNTAPGSANFSGANWTSGTTSGAGTGTPASGDSLYFGASTQLSPNNDDSGFMFAGLTFNSGASAFTIGGNAFALGGNIVNSSTSAEIINNNIALNANESANATSGNLTLGGIISGSYVLTASGSSSYFLTLSGVNTYSGGTTISSGKVSINSASALGSGNLTLANGASSPTLDASAGLTLASGLTITAGNSGHPTVVSTFANLTASTTFEIDSLITGTSGNVKSGSNTGTVRFANNANSYATFQMGAGITEFTSVANAGSASALGAGSGGGLGNTTYVLGNGASAATFRYVGAGSGSTTRQIDWQGTTGGLALDASGGGAVQYLATGNFRSGSGSATLTLTGSNTGTNTLAQVINDNGGINTLTKSGVGTWILIGANIFSGGVNLNSGVLQVNAMETAGTSGPLGKSGTLSFGGGTLQYSPADTADYSSRFSTAAGQAVNVDLNGQSVTFATPLVSSNGTLTVNSFVPGGTLVLSQTNTFTGNVTVLGGTLSVSNDPALGAKTNYVVLNGGTLAAAANFTFYTNRTLALGPDSGNGGGTLSVPAGVTLTVNGNIADNGGPGSLTITGAGTLAISTSGRSYYTGNTTISNGTLFIVGNGTLGTNGYLTIASGATLDVNSATGGRTLGSGQTLVAGNGTSFVNGKLSLGSAALALFWTNGVPSLTIFSNKLTMNNNVTTITVAGSTPLPVGVYKIISKGTGGSVSGAVFNSLVNVTGAGAAASTSLQITSGELYLDVHGGSATTTIIASSATTNAYGNPVTFTASVSPTNATGIVTFTDGTTTYGTAILVGGQASLAVAGGTFSPGTYTMSTIYAGNSTYAPSTSGVLTQIVTQATLTVAANNLTRWVGNANPTLTASYIGFVAGDTAAILSGTPSLSTSATSASPAGNYTITNAPGTLVDTSGNYVLTFTNGTLSVIARAMPYPQGTAFPLMMYEVGDAPSAANVASYGWNIIQNYGLTTNSDLNSFLQLAYADSLGGDAHIGCNGAASTNFVEWPQAQVQAWIQGSMTNNNIAWWDMPEEMRSWMPTEVQLLGDYRKWVQLYDTNGQRPTYEYTPNSRYTATQIGVITNVDIIGSSCYCEAAGQPHAWVRYKVQEAGVHAVTLGGCTIGSNYLAGQKTVVGVLYLADPGNGLLPTPQQSYHDVWSSIASGAQGINVWAYWHGVNDNPVLTNNLNQFNLAASQISGSEIGQVILYGTQNKNVSFVVTSGPTNTVSFNPGDGTNWTYPSINVLCKTWSNNVYVIAVNSTSNAVTANITNLPLTNGLATLPFELRSLVVSGNGFADTFAPWGVHVYKINAVSNVPPAFITDPFSLPAATIGSAYSNSIAASATDTNGDPLIFSKISGPAWLNIATNGVITGTPGYADFGTNSFTVQAADSGDAGNAATATLLIPVSSPNCGPTVVLNENFAGETIATLAGLGWTFSGQPNAELVGSTANSAYLGTISYLRIGSNTVSQPFAQKSFGAVTNGQFKAITFTTSSYCNAGIKLLDANNNILLAFYLPTPTSLAVSNINPVFPQLTMPNGATHNLLSSSSPPLAFDELTVTWGGSNVTWQVVNLNATNGAVVYDTGLQTGTFTGTAVPSQLRLDTGTYNNSARYFGTTDIQVMDTTGCSGDPAVPPVILPGSNAAGGNFNFQFNGTLGQHYQVEFTPELPVVGAWQVVTDIVSLTTSPFSISQPMTNSQGYYRVSFFP